MNTGFISWGAKNVLELDEGDGYSELLKTTQLCALNVDFYGMSLYLNKKQNKTNSIKKTT